LQKVDKGDDTRLKTTNCDVRISVLSKFQFFFTANWDIAQKNGFHYHNLVFMLNLIL